jgi:hypothetical protein
MRHVPFRAAVVLLLAGAALSVASPAVAADPATDFSYTLSGSSATITGYLGTNTDVDIPATILDGGITYTVTAIGDNAFRGNFLPARLTSVIIPDTVTTIGDNAFRFDALTSITIPDSVISIGTYAFYNNVLTSVTLGDSLATLGNNSFRGNLLASVTFPASVTSIGNTTFAENPLLTTAIFAGSAPSTFTAAGPMGSFLGVTPTVYFYPGASGFTGSWNGYPTLAISAATSELSLAPSGSVVADGVTPFTLTAVVRDSTNAPVAGVPVSFTVPAGVSASATGCVTTTNGTCAITLTSGSAATYAIAATVGSDPAVLTRNVTFTAVPGANPTTSSTGSGPTLASTGTDTRAQLTLAGGLLTLGLALLGASVLRRRKRLG